MQIYNLHIYQKMPLTPTLFAKQGDIGRKFKAVITDGTEGYTIPADAVLSVWYAGASGEGNYSSIGDRSAFTVSGNTVEVELIAQMLKNKGQGALCLVMNSADGFRIGTWNIPYEVEAVPGMGSAPADPTPDIYAQILADYAETQSKLANLYMCATDDGTGVVTVSFETEEVDEETDYKNHIILIDQTTGMKYKVYVSAGKLTMEEVEV